MARCGPARHGMARRGRYGVGGRLGTVRQIIDSIESPRTIRGVAGEKFTIKVICRTEGEGSNYLYLELLKDGVSIGEGRTPEPVAPNMQVTWTGEIELLKTIPNGTTLYFTVQSGHLEAETKVRDDTRDFSILVKRWAIPLWMVAVGLAVPLVMVGGWATLRR